MWTVTSESACRQRAAVLCPRECQMSCLSEIFQACADCKTSECNLEPHQSGHVRPHCKRRLLWAGCHCIHLDYMLGSLIVDAVFHQKLQPGLCLTCDRLCAAGRAGRASKCGGRSAKRAPTSHGIRLISHSSPAIPRWPKQKAHIRSQAKPKAERVENEGASSCKK